MLLDFVKQELQNFKSFNGDGHALRLDGEPGLVFVRGRNRVEKRLGSNGSGKSSLTDAMTWTLFGRTAGGLRNPDIQAWNGSKTTRGALTIRVDGTKHVIERTANPNRLRIDGKDAGQEAVERLIGIDFDTFTQTVLFAQGQPLFLDMAPRDKMALFSTVLDLDRWDRYSKGAGEQVHELELQEYDHQAEIAACEAALKEVEETLTDLRDQSRAWEQERTARSDKIDADMAESKKFLDTVAKNHAAADVAYDAAMTDKRFVDSEIMTAQNNLMEWRSVLSAAETERASRLRDVKRYEQELQQLGEGDTCPTCGQSLKGTDLEKHQREARKLLDKLRKSIREPVKERQQVEVGQKLVANLQEVWKVRELEARRAGAERDSLHPRMTELETRIRLLERQRSESADQPNPYNAQLSVLRKKRGTLNSELRDLDEVLTKTRRKLERSKYWIKGFREIRLFVLDEVLQEMEMACNTMLEEMGLIGWQMLFTTEKETKSGTIQRGIIVTIKSPTNSKPVRWECWSGGEGQRLRLTGALALAEVLLNHANVDPNIVVLDEPTAHLSAEGVRDLCEFLASYAEQLERRVFFTDHMQVESGTASEVIMIEKTEEGSHIVS